MEAIKKANRGRKPLPADEKRVVFVATKLTQDEAWLVESRRGEMPRAEWIREAALGNAPVPVPEINKQAWIDLGRALNNLNQIARKLNSGRSLEQAQLEKEIADLRDKLVGLAD